jgi:GntR family transcriptional regulator
MSTYVSHTQNRLTSPPPNRPRDRRARNTFWIDDRIVDDFAPVMARYSAGVAALSVYIALARHADRQGESWPGLTTIAAEVGVSSRTVQRAIRLLEMLGLIDVTTCYEEATHRQTSNLYTLLTLPPQLPGIDPDERRWPPPRRRTLWIRRGPRGEAIASARGVSDAAESVATPWQPDTLPHDTASPTPCHDDTLPRVSVSPQEGNTHEENTTKGERARHDSAESAHLVIAEIGLSNRQVWAAILAELATGNSISRAEIETWLRPAALIGREGETLIIGAPNNVARDRITRRLLPALRDAIAATVGAPLDLRVVTAPAPGEAT